MSEPILTIAIPTYNRAEKLAIQLGCLVPQLTPQVRCLVYDNASTDHTRAIAEKYSSAGVAYSCAPYNGGGERNFLRCFEECQTDWLWILSDDDPVLPDAAAKILALVASSSCDFIHTSSPLRRYATDETVSDIPQLLKKSDLSALLFISTGIYRMSAFRPLMRVFVSAISTWVPHLVTVLALMEGSAGKLLLSTASLTSSHPGAPRWSTLGFILRFSHLPEYVKQEDHRKIIAQGVIGYIYWAMMTGLREIKDQESVFQWKRTAKMALHNLACYGSPSPARLLFDYCLNSRNPVKWYFAIREPAQFFILMQSPGCMFIRMAKRWIRK